MVSFTPVHNVCPPSGSQSGHFLLVWYILRKANAVLALQPRVPTRRKGLPSSHLTMPYDDTKFTSFITLNLQQRWKQCWIVPQNCNYSRYRLVRGTWDWKKSALSAICVVNIVLHSVITDFKHYIRVITDFTPRYNRFFALYPINFTVVKLGPF